MNLNDLNPVEYTYKSTTAFDDQYEVGIIAEEIAKVLPGTFSIDTAAMEEARNTITFHAGNTNNEMLRVSPKGFWVRGVKVEQDDKEAEVVYNAFKQWLVWSEMNRR
jgi:hypothetical protein